MRGNQVRGASDNIPEFGSAVSAGLNNHLQNQQIGNSQNYLHNLARNQVTVIGGNTGAGPGTSTGTNQGYIDSGVGGGVSIID